MTKANSLSRWLAAAMAALMLLALLPARVWAAESTAYDTDGATAFTFTDSAITTKDGNYTGYDIDGTALTIEAAGTYIVSGSCQSGSITVKKGVTGVTLVLSGLTLTADGTAAIACNKSSGVTIVAQDGTTNILSDTETNNDDSYPDNTNAENAVIKCKDGSQVTLCGSGSLTVNANGKNGIKSGAATDEEGEAWLVIRDLTLTISAPVNDAINAEASLTILSGDLTIDAGDDAVHSDYYLTVGAAGTDGPTITVNSCNEGLEAADLSITGGNITIHAGDDCLNAANSDLTGYAFTLSISGGTLVMDTTSGDGIDSNGTLSVSGGTVVVWTNSTADNQPLDADGTLSITGGTVLAAGGSAGMGITLSGDSQPYVMFGSTGMGGMGGGRPGSIGGGRPGSIGGQPGGSSDGTTPPEKPDGTDDSTTPPQLPGGSDSSSGSRPTPPSGSGSSSDSRPTPPSGSNGSQPTPPDGSGGTTPPELPDGQTAPDGSSDSQPGGQMPGQMDGQSGSSISISKGSTLTIRSSDGTAVYTGEAVYDARFVFFSSAAMTSGETYTLTSGGTELATATAGGTGTAAVTTPDTSAGTADTHQTSDSHAALYITLGTVAVLGAAAAMVVVVLRKQKKA